uniref:Uncharacterized protein n=1 Tax=Romanomermis culicivorax TaxID=13658 RepID=A0A915HYT1_ROMCU
MKVVPSTKVVPSSKHFVRRPPINENLQEFEPHFLKVLVVKWYRICGVSIGFISGLLPQNYVKFSNSKQVLHLFTRQKRDDGLVATYLQCSGNPCRKSPYAALNSRLAAADRTKATMLNFGDE